MKNTQPLSPLAESAVKLSQYFTQFQVLSSELERRSIESDKGLERAGELISDLEVCGQGIQRSLLEFTEKLHAEREKTEQCAQLVAGKAESIAERRQVVEKMAGRLREFGERVQEITAEIATLKTDNATEVHEIDALMKEKAANITEKLTVMIDDAAHIKSEAHSLHLESFERTADRLRQSLSSAGNRLRKFAS